MQRETANRLIRSLQEVAGAYRDAAAEACRDESPYDVYFLMRDMMAAESKMRSLSRRYLSMD